MLFVYSTFHVKYYVLLSDYGLMCYYNTDMAVTETIHLYLTWNYLPMKEMKAGLRRIRKSIKVIKKKELRIKFRKFHDQYMKPFWLKKITPRRLSVHGLTRRSTNDLESLHRKMKAFLPERPYFPRFLHHLKQNIFILATEVLGLISTNQQLQAKAKPKQERRNK